MFGKTQRQQQTVEPWRILQWWRNGQEYVPWLAVDDSAEFLHRLSNEDIHVLVEFDNEISVLTQQSELWGVFEQLEQTAKAQLASHLAVESVPLLRSLELGRGKVIVKPFVAQPPLMDFLPPVWHELEQQLSLLFTDSRTIKQELDRRFLQWKAHFEPERIDQYVYKRSREFFQELLNNQAEQTRFDALITIVSEFDRQTQAADQIESQQFLKQVWGVPLFIFADNPSEAAVVRLLITKSLKRQRAQLESEFQKLYRSKLLAWQLSQPFSATELSRLQECVQRDASAVFLTGQVFHLYRHLLERCAIPFEFSELYGADAYVKTLLEAFSTFPKNEEEERQLSGTALYGVLLSEAIRFGMRFWKEMCATPAELLRALVGIMVGRLGEYEAQARA